jgi:AcrR family transcriptional regulator
MPKLWDKTIEAHLSAVRTAIVDAAAALATTRSPRSVTMSEIAEQAGIGRATLYKYFSSVEAILTVWHERHIADHLAHLAEIRDRPGSAVERLEAVLATYANIVHHRDSHGAKLVAVLHRGAHVARAERRLKALICDLLSKAAATGDVRTDVVPDELATYCLNALAAASSLPSKAAIRRLVAVTLTGLRSRT